MNISEDKFLRLMRFLDGEMDPAEIHAFEQELHADPNLKELLQFQLNLFASYRANAEQPAHPGNAIDEHKLALSAMMEEAKIAYHANLPSPSPLTSVNLEVPKSRIYAYSYRLVAASVLVMAFISSIIFYSGRKNEFVPPIVINTDTAFEKRQPQLARPELNTPIEKKDSIPESKKLMALIDKYYEKDQPPADIPEQLEEALTLFKDNKYQVIQELDLAALPRSRGGSDEQRIDELGHYYKGLSFIETGNYSSASINLAWVADSSSDPLLKVKAEWYLAILHLKNSKTEKAKALLLKISANKISPAYKQKASNLLQDLGVL